MPQQRRTPLIATLTPNPALDLSGIVNTLTPNEKNAVHQERRDPGGNGLNAARVAHRLGARVLALGFAGGSVGDELIELVRKEKVPCRMIRIHGNTRINITVTREDTHQQTRLSFAGPRIQRTEWQRLLTAIDRLPQQGLLLLGGSLPPGVPSDYHTRLALRASRHGLGVIIDVPPSVLDETLKQGRGAFKPLLVKPNETELAQWWSAGRKVTFKNESELMKAAHELAQQCSLVCISRGARGLILVHGKHHWRFVAPKIHARGTVGAGDSLLGAISASLADSGVLTPVQVEEAFSDCATGQLPRAIRHAMIQGLAAGAATASELGTSLARPAVIRKLVRAAEKLNPVT